MRGTPCTFLALILTGFLFSCLLGGCNVSRYVAAGLHSGRGESFMSQKRYEEAAREFTEAARVYPGSPWEERALYMKGQALFGKGDFKDAIVVLRSLIETKGTDQWDREARFLMCESHFSAGDILAAQNVAQELTAGKDDISRRADDLLGRIKARMAELSNPAMERLTAAWKEYMAAYNSYTALMFKIASGKYVEPEEIHRRFEEVKKTQEVYKNLLAESGRADVDDPVETARKKYMAAYENYIKLVKNLHPDEYDRPEVHKALEEYQLNKRDYLSLKAASPHAQPRDLAGETGEAFGAEGGNGGKK